MTVWTLSWEFHGLELHYIELNGLELHYIELYGLELHGLFYHNITRIIELNKFSTNNSNSVLNWVILW